MHGLVRDELLEERGGRVPGDATQLEQPDVEEGGELGLELVVEVGKLRVVARDPQHVGAEVDEELHPALEPAEQPQQAVGRGGERVAQAPLRGPTLGGRCRYRRQGSDRIVDRGRIGPEVAREHEREVAPAVVRQRDVRVGNGRGLRALRHRVVQPEELPDHVAQPRRVTLRESRREIERGRAQARPADRAAVVDRRTGATPRRGVRRFRRGRSPSRCRARTAGVCPVGHR